MRKFPLISQGGFENLVDSRGDARLRFDHLEHVQQDCPETAEIELGVLAAGNLYEPLVHEGPTSLRVRPEAGPVRRGIAST